MLRPGIEPMTSRSPKRTLYLLQKSIFIAMATDKTITSYILQMVCQVAAIHEVTAIDETNRFTLTT